MSSNYFFLLAIKNSNHIQETTVTHYKKEYWYLCTNTVLSYDHFTATTTNTQYRYPFIFTLLFLSLFINSTSLLLNKFTRVSFHFSISSFLDSFGNSAFHLPDLFGYQIFNRFLISSLILMKILINYTLPSFHFFLFLFLLENDLSHNFSSVISAFDYC